MNFFQSIRYSQRDLFTVEAKRPKIANVARRKLNDNSLIRIGIECFVFPMAALLLLFNLSSVVAVVLRFFIRITSSDEVLADCIDDSSTDDDELSSDIKCFSFAV